MADNLKIPPPAPLIDERGDTASSSTGDTGNGFNLISWVFDHIKARRPIFLTLHDQYDRDVKFSANWLTRFFGFILLLLCVLLDIIIFLSYALATVLVILGVTFIFVKGTGLLDYFFPNGITLIGSML